MYLLNNYVLSKIKMYLDIKVIDCSLLTWVDQRLDHHQVSMKLLIISFFFAMLQSLLLLFPMLRWQVRIAFHSIHLRWRFHTIKRYFICTFTIHILVHSFCLWFVWISMNENLNQDFIGNSSLSYMQCLWSYMVTGYC